MKITQDMYLGFLGSVGLLVVFVIGHVYNIEGFSILGQGFYWLLAISPFLIEKEERADMIKDKIANRDEYAFPLWCNVTWHFFVLLTIAWFGHYWLAIVFLFYIAMSSDIQQQVEKGINNQNKE